jgi:hypothetical protein
MNATQITSSKGAIQGNVLPPSLMPPANIDNMETIVLDSTASSTIEIHQAPQDIKGLSDNKAEELNRRIEAVDIKTIDEKAVPEGDQDYRQRYY